MYFEDYVLGLEVAMDDVLRVHVGERLQDLVDDREPLHFLLRAFLDDRLEQVGALVQFAETVDVILALSQGPYKGGFN